MTVEAIDAAVQCNNYNREQPESLNNLTFMTWTK